MFDLLLTGPYVPFTVALALLGGLLALELALLVVGGSLLGAEVDADGAELDGGSGPAAWLGLDEAPAMVWLAAALLGFGAAGLAVQAAAEAVAAPLPGWLAAVPAAVAALAFARTFGRALARLIPGTESSAQTARQLARRPGRVTQGTALRGRSAEVRVTDRHGNIHYLRAEPLRDEDVIPQGSDVIVLRDPRGDGYRLIPITEPG